MQNKYETINLDYPSVADLIEALKKFPPEATICLDSSLPTGVMLSYDIDTREFEGEPNIEETVNLEWYDPSPYADY